MVLIREDFLTGSITGCLTNHGFGGADAQRVELDFVASLPTKEQYEKMQTARSIVELYLLEIADVATLEGRTPFLLSKGGCPLRIETAYPIIDGDVIKVPVFVSAEYEHVTKEGAAPISVRQTYSDKPFIVEENGGGLRLRNSPSAKEFRESLLEDALQNCATPPVEALSVMSLRPLFF